MRRNLTRDRKNTILVLTTFLIGFITQSVSYGDIGHGNRMIYWTDAETDRIQRSNLDGTNVKTLVTGLNKPLCIALDVDARKMYWGIHSKNEIGQILRSNLDGSKIETLVAGIGQPDSIALDVIEGKMYWSEWGWGKNKDKILRANIDGSNMEILITGLSSPSDIALDVQNRKIYWTSVFSYKIQRANFDGSHKEDIIKVGSFSNIVLDARNKKIYWSSQNLFGDSIDKIQRANLDGSSIEDVITGLDGPDNIVLDIVGEKIYWTVMTDAKRSQIQRADLKGSNPVNVLVTGLGNPSGLAIFISSHSNLHNIK